MKGPLFLLLLLINIATAGAQAVTKEMLKGKWEMVFVEFPGMALDLVNKKCTLSGELADDITQEYRAMAEEQMMQGVGNMEGSLVFDDVLLTSKITQKGETGIDQGPYEIKATTPVTLEVVMPQGKMILEIWFKDDNLMLKKHEDQGVFTYKKVNN
ncbi:hypothetical protein AM493_18435 [Flavobacterium akiainvivens]|uniref:Lipocalin-like domain-containing protein n=1 Tax=Flavobacterium akiainvivens TaxID=1202724 RepID=A0A0M9VJT6_9FLAO|nr:hypothetical protein [Flavobacterium akiainvivens]KOS07809.1 hypothetical protein AM493_18435 [Flavobacterium akiainvivens]SFQ26805.1 hypothetical protein SAMN05444144_102269 [Flavobacterium akiainvivens]